MQYKYLTITQFARKHGVSRQLVIDWINFGRVSSYSPALGIRLIPVDCNRPKRLTPWENKRKVRLACET